jgi:ferredoxin-type protein NapG
MTRRISRKELFTDLLSAVRGPRRQELPPADLRPPGAVAPDDAYLAACSGCEACVKACPYEAITLVDSSGDPPRRVAAIHAVRRPCRLCEALPCIAACDDGALLPLPSRRDVRIGVAQVDPRSCRTFHGDPCDLCVKHCPLAGEAIRLIGGRPVVMPGTCTGCGICEAACPDRPRSIRVVPERDLVPGLRIPRQMPGSAPRG